MKKSINKQLEQVNATIEQLEATNLVYALRIKSDNDNKLSKELGMSKVTLYTRLKQSNWKKTELALIEKLSFSGN